MSSIGHPVVCDPLYGSEKSNTKFRKDFYLERMFLHSGSLTIILPNAKEAEYTALLAPDLQKTLEMLEYS
jgi:23S rRNA-/tRNA-specific pseudouridylate synthase